MRKPVSAPVTGAAFARPQTKFRVWLLNVSLTDLLVEAMFSLLAE